MADDAENLAFASMGAFLPSAFIRETGTDQTIRMVGLESNLRF
jgi:hypothetical protein